MHMKGHTDHWCKVHCDLAKLQAHRKVFMQFTLILTFDIFIRYVIGTNCRSTQRYASKCSLGFLSILVWHTRWPTCIHFLLPVHLWSPQYAWTKKASESRIHVTDYLWTQWDVPSCSHSVGCVHYFPRYSGMGSQAMFPPLFVNFTCTGHEMAWSGKFQVIVGRL